MSHSTTERTSAGTAPSASSNTTHDDCSHCARSKVLLSFTHALKEATYIIAGLLGVLYLFSVMCEIDLAEHEVQRLEQINRSVQQPFYERSSTCSGNCRIG